MRGKEVDAICQAWLEKKLEAEAKAKQTDQKKNEHTGVYVAGRELSRTQLRDYIQVLRKRIENRQARGLDDTFTSREMKKGIEEYKRILG